MKNDQQPYLTQTITVYNPHYGDERICKCGHPYHRHFDGYEGNAPVGCKYCDCRTFDEAALDERSLVVDLDLIRRSSTPFLGFLKISENYNDVSVVFPLEYLEELARMARRMKGLVDKEVNHHLPLLDSFISISDEAEKFEKESRLQE